MFLGCVQLTSQQRQGQRLPVPLHVAIAVLATARVPSAFQPRDNCGLGTDLSVNVFLNPPPPK